jgi:hypothetical protein
MSFRRRKSVWAQFGPTPRLIVGAVVIVIIGLIGMTPKVVGGFTIPWPYAAFWGAVGWGRVGLSLRPMVLLVLFGFAQDFGFDAPLGCFALLNLIVYGLSAAIADTLDVRQPLIAIVAPAVLFCAVFLLTWMLASLLEDHPVRVWPLLRTLLVTGLSYALIQIVFDLGRKPGEIAGRGI